MFSRSSKKVLIIGAGFAGTNVYLELHKKLHGTGHLEITIVNPTDYFGFTPLIHEVATGSLQPGGVQQSLRLLPACCLDRFVLGSATEVDCFKKVVRVRLAGKPGDPNVLADDFVEIPYDYLVLAMGSETNFFDVPGVSENTLELNDAIHARILKNHVIERFEHARTLDDPELQKEDLSFVVVGGGPTGVEIAGELADFVSVLVNKSFPELSQYTRVLIIERGDQLLKHGIDKWFSIKATKILERKKRVYIAYETSVIEVKENGVQTNRGFIESNTVIWAAGVVARTIAFHGSHEVECEDRSCRTRVNNFLQIDEHKNIFVLGDQAWVCDRENDQAYPMRAQFAVREGKTAARNIAHLINGEPLEEFYFSEKGLIISLGKGGAIASIYGIRVSGPIAWFVYRAAYLSTMIGWRTRLRTLLEWMMNVFLPRDVSKL